MADKISRREILALGAATIAGVGLSKNLAHATDHGGSGAAYQPFRGYNPPRGGSRPYWERAIVEDRSMSSRSPQFCRDEVINP
jgi:hypothetical protein